MEQCKWQNRNFGELSAVFVDFDSTLAIWNNTPGIKFKSDFDKYVAMWSQLIAGIPMCELSVFDGKCSPNIALNEFLTSLPKNVNLYCISTDSTSLVAPFKEGFLDDKFDAGFERIIIVKDDDMKLEIISAYTQAKCIYPERVLLIDDNATTLRKAAELHFQVAQPQEFMNR